MKQSIQVWHLEYPDTEQLVKALPAREYQLHRIESNLPELYRFLYIAVGAPWKWYMRLHWSYLQWQKFMARPEIEIWVGYQGATPIGYFELAKRPAATVEMSYFGLMPESIGNGLGGPFLEDALLKARDLGGHRISLHTCSMDHPNALSNYLSRGFRIVREDAITDDVPNDIQPWVNADKPAFKLIDDKTSKDQRW
jgi:GNAT superfamily N-acetyltransferase